MNRNINLYILIMFAVSYTIRALPLTLIRGKIRSPALFSRIDLMLPPEIIQINDPHDAGGKKTQSRHGQAEGIQSTQTPLSGLFALVAGVIAAWFGASLFQVASLCCVVVLIAEFIIL